MADRHDADELLVVALAAGQTVTAAAASAGVGVKTARRRLALPWFRAEIRRRRAEVVGEAVAKLTQNMTAASDKLVSLMNDPDATVQLRAAVKVIELGFRGAEVADLEQRVRELEHQQEPEAEEPA